MTKLEVIDRQIELARKSEYPPFSTAYAEGMIEMAEVCEQITYEQGAVRRRDLAEIESKYWSEALRA